jgi:hypothetical protein
VYKITDIVEAGHSKEIGGSVKISITFDNILPKEEKEKVLDVIDRLDHSLITDNKDFLDFTERYTLLKQSKSPLEDIVGIISSYLSDFEEIEVSIGKETFISKRNPVEIIDSNFEK